MTSMDNDGVDRQTYEDSNCGSTKPHDQHFHSPIGGLTLNCPGVAATEKIDTVGQGIDRINARYFDEAGNRASGLCLEEIGLSGHGVANTLWRISAYLKERAGDNG